MNDKLTRGGRGGILVNYSIQVCDSILVHPILIDSEERVVGVCEENSWEVALAC